MRLSELVSYLDGFLEAGRGSDSCPNGLQVEGRAEIAKLVTGVSACRELFVRAREAGADAVLVHHGLFWDGGSANKPPLTGLLYRRVAELIRSDIALIAYHLPLDRHPEVGNNAVAMRALGIDELIPFAEFGGESVGFHGRLVEPVAPDELARRCSEIFGQEPALVGDGPDQISRIGMVSGGGESVLHEAIDLGLDAYITGEIKEWVMNVAREAGVHYLTAGHYATERLGILALGKHLAERFGLEVEFVDIPNPV